MKKILITFFALLLSFSINAKEIKLTADNTAVLRQSFNSSSVTALKADLLKLNANLKSGYPIYLVLNTPGGSIQKGLELFEFIKGLNRPVHTLTIFAASMGFQAVQHLGTRYILNYGVLMSHNAYGGAQGAFNGTGKGQLQSRLGLWYRRVSMMDALTVKRSNGKQTMKSYTSAYSPELWLNGPEAVKQGYADEVATVACGISLTGTEVVKVLDLGFFRIRVRFSGCPLITAPLGISGELLTNDGFKTIDEFLGSNGQFGEKCRGRAIKASKDYYGNITPATPAQLCAYDKTITLDKIKKKLEIKEKFFNRDLRNHVEYSY